MLRINHILPLLDYDNLVKSGYIPDLLSSCEDKIKSFKTTRYPKWIYPKNKSDQGRFSEFGLYMDYMVRKMIQSIPNMNVQLGDEPLKPDSIFNPELDISTINKEEYEPYFHQWLSSYRHQDTKWTEMAYPTHYIISNLYSLNSCISKQDFGSIYPLLGSINKSIVEMFQPCTDVGLSFNSELHSGNLFGHPDIISNNMILDIKNTAGFAKMARSSFLQILCYTALARQMNRSVEYIGILLSMQKDILLFDVRDWDSQPFHDLLITLINQK
jgi:hypothetical protein